MKGERGPRGYPGTGAGPAYEHVQDAASAAWVVNQCGELNRHGASAAH